MTTQEVEKSFARERARRPSPERLMKMLDAQARRFKEHPEEGRELAVRAGVLTRAGRWTKPYRAMIQRDREEAALETARG